MERKTGFVIAFLTVFLASSLSAMAQEQIEYENVDIQCIGTGGEGEFVISTQEEYQELIDNSPDLQPNPAFYCIDYEFPEIDFEANVLLIKKVNGGGCNVLVEKSVTTTPEKEYPTAQIFTYKIVWKEIGTCEKAQFKNVAVTIPRQAFLDKMVDYPYRDAVKFVVEKNEPLGDDFASVVPGVFSTPFTVAGVSIAPSTAANRVVLTQDGFSVETASSLEIIDGIFYMDTSSGPTIAVSVLPAQARTSIITNAKIDPATATATVLEVKNNTPFYTASAKKKGNLLFIIPVEYDVTVEVNAQTGTTVVNKPWWTVFVTG